MNVPSPLLFKNFPYKLILASASPRRRELLTSLGFSYTGTSLDVDESGWPADLKAQDIALYLAKLKAGAYRKELKADEIVITADTIVWCENKIYNKPGDFEDGKRMLRSLSGKMHQVFTAVCLRGKDKQIIFYDESRVFFKRLTDAEIEFYLTEYRPYDKAGAYGVQDWLGYTGIEKIEGSFYNVMGLPVKPLYEELMRF